LVQVVELACSTGLSTHFVVIRRIDVSSAGDLAAGSIRTHELEIAATKLSVDAACWRVVVVLTRIEAEIARDELTCSSSAGSTCQLVEAVRWESSEELELAWRRVCTDLVGGINKEGVAWNTCRSAVHALIVDVVCGGCARHAEVVANVQVWCVAGPELSRISVSDCSLLWNDADPAVFDRSVAAVRCHKNAVITSTTRAGLEVVFTRADAESIEVLQCCAINTCQWPSVSYVSGLRLEVSGTWGHLRSAETQAVGGKDILIYIACSEAVEALVVHPLVGLVARYAHEVQQI
jgi:hypothetical protein